jgi:uncharacterized protein YprB with RNaseH-like and TPR domain
MLSIAGKVVGNGAAEYLAPGFVPDELEAFIQPIRQGCMVLTHNGPRYDLPFLNGTLIRLGLAPLPRLLVTDTYAHLPKRGAAFSASLANMTRRFEVKHQKLQMSEYEWDLAYQGDPDALVKLRTYNIGDVAATIALWEKLRSLRLLGSPRWWSP